MLQAQSTREPNLWQTGHEIAEKSSKIVTLGAPLLATSREDCRKVGRNHSLSAHETGRGKRTSMSLHSGLGGREYTKRELGFIRAFPLNKTKTRSEHEFRIAPAISQVSCLACFKGRVALAANMNPRAFSVQQKKAKDLHLHRNSSA